MAILGISGYSNSGKDTIGIIIQYLLCADKGGVSIEEAIKNYKDHKWWLQEQSGWEIKKFAGKLKDIASHLTGIPIEKFEDQEFKKTNLDSEWDIWDYKSIIEGTAVEPVFNKEVFKRNMTVREFLQKLGTDSLRNRLHDNVWVNALMTDYNCVPADLAPNGWDCDNWIITDTRFPNEAKAIKDKGGIIIRVERPGVAPINNHPSEIGLDDWEFDYKIANVSDVISLMYSVENILKHHKII